MEQQYKKEQSNPYLSLKKWTISYGIKNLNIKKSNHGKVSIIQCDLSDIRRDDHFLCIKTEEIVKGKTKNVFTRPHKCVYL